MPGGQQRFNDALDAEAGKHFIVMGMHIKTRIEAITLNQAQLAQFKSIDLNSLVMGKLLKAILTSDNDARDRFGESYTYINLSEQSSLFRFPESITLPDGRKINIFINYSQLNDPVKELWQLYYSEATEEV